MPSFNAQRQLFRRNPIEDIARGLSEHEPVIYEDGGSRTTDGSRLLADLEALMPSLGITRVGNVSHLADGEWFVFQSSRPNLHAHSILGQATSSQGKGGTLRQAKLSCLMETVEILCAEGREPQLIRGSYRELKRAWPVSDPRCFLGMFTPHHVEDDETLVWEWAYHVQSGDRVLVPASLVYFPLIASDYDTKKHYPGTSNGLASGATYLEAVVHGLYEVIERHYIALAELGHGTRHDLDPSDVSTFDVEAFNREHQGTHELRLHLDYQPSLGTNLAFVECELSGPVGLRGHGCSSRLDLSVSRAISECIQGHATVASGAGESHFALGRVPTPSAHLFRDIEIGAPTSAHDLEGRVVERRFDTLRDEMDFILGWLKQAGYESVYLANLTRAGIEIPVVKVLVPGLLLPLAYRYSAGHKEVHFQDVVRARYPNIRAK